MVKNCGDPNCLSCMWREKWRERKRQQRIKEKQEKNLNIIKENLRERFAANEANRK